MSRENVYFSVDVMAGKIGIPSEILIDTENGRSEISLCLLQKTAMVLGLNINRLNTISASLSDPKDEIKVLHEDFYCLYNRYLSNAYKTIIFIS